MDRMVEASMPKARAIGVVYLLYFLAAFCAAFLMKGLVVSSDAAATANNILSHEALYRTGLAADLIANLIYIALTALFYRLFEPVNRTLSLLAAFFSLVGCAIQISGSLLQRAPLVFLGGGQWLTTFKVEQLQAAALLCLKLHSQTFHISLVIFAFYDLLIGYLIFRSMFVPRILGAWMMVAGLGWLTFLWPPLATSLASYIQSVGGLAELFLMLWLLVKGVNVSKWQEQAGIGQVSSA